MLVGPSNTGKSYLAALLYSLQRFLNAWGGDRRWVSTSGWAMLRPPMMLEDYALLSHPQLDHLLAWAVQQPGLKSGTVRPEGTIFPRPEPFAEMVRDAVANVSTAASLFGAMLERNFHVDDAHQLRRRGSREPARLMLRAVPESTDAPMARYEFDIAEGGVAARGEVPQAAVLEYGQVFPLPVDGLHYILDEGQLLRNLGDVARDNLARVVLAGLCYDVATYLLGPARQRVFYLPAHRGGIMHARDPVERAALESMSGGLSPGITLPGILADFLRELFPEGASIPEDPLQGVAEWVAGKSGFEDTGRRLEQQVLRGDIRVRRDMGRYPQVDYVPRGWDQGMGLTNAAASVSELAPLVLYLKNVVRVGETLIVEEPETNLHPAMQVELIRVLADAVRQGLRLIITTHSEWILEESANLVRLAELPPEARSGIPGGGVSLAPEDVGAWLFHPGEDGAGSQVERIDLDLAAGEFPTGFTLVGEDLYARWAAINNRIGGE